MRRNRRDEALRWLRQAEEDPADARSALERGRYHLACFLAQQSAGKALKGFLLGQGAESVWGHSVAELADACARLDPSFAGTRPQGAYLDRFYLPTRYPDALPGAIPAEAFDEEDARKALGRAEDFLRRARRALGQEGPGGQEA